MLFSRFRKPPSRAALLSGLAVAAIALNVVQFPGIERARYDEMRAIGRYDTSDLAAVTYRTCSWCRQRYGLYLALGVIAPGAKVIIATPGPYTKDRQTSDETASRLRVFGRASAVTLVPSTMAVTGPGFDPTPHVMVTGGGGTKGGPWAFAAEHAGGVVANPRGYLNRIVTGEGPARSATIREFVLVRWEQRQRGSTFAYQELLVETSLLPADVRAGLAG